MSEDSVEEVQNEKEENESHGISDSLNIPSYL